MSTHVESLQELLDQLCAKESNCSHEISLILFQSQHVFPSLLSREEIGGDGITP